VQMQLEEYELLARKDARVDASHVEALLRLVGRRPDAYLVFADAARRAARRAVARISSVSRLAARTAPRLFGHRAARRAARAVLGSIPAGTRVLGIHGMGTRRFFVLLPRDGKPVALAHRIELAAFDGFPGEVRPHAAWPELHEQLRALVVGKTVTMEISPRDAVPYLDRVPHGVIELIEASGAHVVSSGVLVSRFAARWSPAELAGHRRAAEAIAEIAVATLQWAGSELSRGAEVREAATQSR